MRAFHLLKVALPHAQPFPDGELQQMAPGERRVVIGMERATTIADLEQLIVARDFQILSDLDAEVGVLELKDEDKFTVTYSTPHSVEYGEVDKFATPEWFVVEEDLAVLHAAAAELDATATDDLEPDLVVGDDDSAAALIQLASAPVRAPDATLGGGAGDNTAAAPEAAAAAVPEATATAPNAAAADANAAAADGAAVAYWRRLRDEIYSGPYIESGAVKLFKHTLRPSNLDDAQKGYYYDG